MRFKAMEVGALQWIDHATINLGNNIVSEIIVVIETFFRLAIEYRTVWQDSSTSSQYEGLALCNIVNRCVSFAST